MPGWAIAALKWGGLALAAINLVAIVWGFVIGAQPTAEVTPTADPTVPYLAYVLLLTLGLLASFLGFLMDRRQRQHEPR